MTSTPTPTEGAYDPHGRLKFTPYGEENASTPMLHFFLRPVTQCLGMQPLLTLIFRLRGILARPLDIRIFPNWFPSIPLPGLRDMPYVSVGELLMLLPLVVLVLATYNYTFVSISVKISGELASYAIFAVFLSASKSNSLFSFILGIPFERMIPFHRIAAIISIFLGGLHTYASFSTDSKATTLIPFLVDDNKNFTGTLLLAFMIALVVLSIFPIIRRYFFDLWLWIHVLSSLGTIIFSFLHAIRFIGYITAWWALDLATRYVVLAGCKYRIKGANLTVLRNDIVCISFPKPPGFYYKPGQFVQIAVPAVTLLQFHPVSISSAPHEDNVTFHMRGLGNWTKKLVELATTTTNGIDLLIEGPYGSVGVDVDNDDHYKMVLLVSGGIGVTHCQSVGKALVHQAKVGRDLKMLRFVWTVRSLDLVEDMPPLGDGVNGRQNGVSVDGFNEPNDDTDHQTINTVHVDQPTMNREQQSGGGYTQGTTMSGQSSTTLKKPIIQTDIYCTSRSGNNLDAPPETFHLHMGRPNMDAIFKEMKRDAILLGEQNIAVFGCGPSPLIHALREACREHSQYVVGCGGVFFDLHTEVFEY